MLNTREETKDMQGSVIADYTSNVFANDFTVRISKECFSNDDTVLMVLAYYYNDKSYETFSE